MSQNLSSSAKRVQAAIKKLGFEFQIKELPESTRTAAEAAAAIDCEVAQIAKSIIFKTKNSLKPVLVIASGANRINETTISQFVNEPIEKAEANFVRDQTGFAIGGVSPVGHLQKLLTFIDQDLLNYPQIWAAAGTPHAVFPLTPDELIKLTQGKVINIS